MTYPHCQCEHCRLKHAAPEIASALNLIACWGDKLANERLEKSGSYSGFDEPGSVKIAREILTTHSLPRPSLSTPEK